MNNYKIKYSVNGAVMEEIIRTYSSQKAKELIMAKYFGQKVVFYSVSMM